MCCARLGRSDELAHSSIRFTVGRFTTQEEIDYTANLVSRQVGRLREMSPLWEMYKDGVDLNTLVWRRIENHTKAQTYFRATVCKKSLAEPDDFLMQRQEKPWHTAAR